MIDEQNLFDQPVRKNLVTYNSIRKIVIIQGDDYAIACLLDNNYFRNCYRMIEIHLHKQKALDTDPKSIQKISFAGNLARVAGATMLFIIEEAKQTVSDILDNF